MVFVWGTKGYGDFLGYIIFECPSCKTKCPFAVEQVRKKFTVYFIPTFNYSNKQYITCTACNASFEVPKNLKPEIANNLMSQEELSSLVKELNMQGVVEHMGIFDNKEKKLVEALKLLSKSVFQCTFSVAEVLSTSLKSEQKKTVDDEQFISIIKEIFCFYLHYLDRIAIQEGGEEYYAWLQDNMVVTCSELLVELLVDTKGVLKGVDAQEWNSKTANECVDLYNKRGQEYISLDLMADSGFPKDDTVFGKLMFHINQIIGTDNIENLGMTIQAPLWLLQSANDVKLADQVRTIKKLQK